MIWETDSKFAIGSCVVGVQRVECHSPASYFIYLTVNTQYFRLNQTWVTWNDVAHNVSINNVFWSLNNLVTLLMLLSTYPGFFQDFQVEGCNRITGGCRPNWDPLHGGLWFGVLQVCWGFNPQMEVWKNPCTYLREVPFLSSICACSFWSWIKVRWRQRRDEWGWWFVQLVFETEPPSGFL
jgi:hypothetical protein